jgi:hypothetical protein
MQMLTIREVIEEEERVAASLLEKCRYAPELLSHQDVEEQLRLVRNLHRLEGAGFKYVTELPNVESNNLAYHPLPEEVWEVYGIVGYIATHATYRVSGKYLVHIGEDYAVVIEEYGDVPKLLEEPMGSDTLQGVPFTFYGREALEEVDWYFRSHAKRFNVEYRPAFTLNHDVYLLTKTPPANTPNFPPLLFFPRTRGLIGRAVCVANPVELPPPDCWKIPVDSWLDHIFSTAASHLQALGSVWAFTPNELPNIGRPIEIGPRTPTNILAARMALRRLGVESYLCYAGGHSMGLFLNHLTSTPAFPIFMHRRAVWSYMLTPFEHVCERVKPARLAFEDNRVVVIDEEEIESMKQGNHEAFLSYEANASVLPRRPPAAPGTSP